MVLKVEVKTTYNCSLERAFKTGILCDVVKVHTGFGIMPKVVYCLDDENWGKPGYGKKVFVEKSITQKGGYGFLDKVLKRVENEYWQIEVSDFQMPMFGFKKFVGEWRTSELEPNKIEVEYTYYLHSDIALFYPINWLFAKTFWRIYMKRILEKVRTMAYDNEPYIYS